MSIYLSEQEVAWWKKHRHDEPAATLRWSILQRAMERSGNPGLMDERATVDWWHLIVEYLGEAAMAYRLQPTDSLGQWIACVVNEIVERDEHEWIGPWFRDHQAVPSRGTLETAHICIALAAAIDLAAEALTPEELGRARNVLGERGVPMCMAELDSPVFMNHRNIAAAGLAAAAVASGHEAGIARSAHEFKLCCELFQSDGSYGESTQYASYGGWGLMVIYESLARLDSALVASLAIDAYARCVRWWATNLMYLKPLAGWGIAPRPRMVNFNDAGVIAAPDADLLLHIAARARHHMPEEAALARWLFDTLCLPIHHDGPYDRAKFGFVTRPGFLAPALLPAASDVQPRGPADLKLPELAAFSNGDVIARDAWQATTVLATHGGGDPLNVSNHQHADLNSFILAHRDERLLVDPGHSCYRGLLIQQDRSTACHNTCTFTLANGETPPGLGNQSTGKRRQIKDGTPLPPVDRGGHRLIAQRIGQVSVIGSECAAAYGQPLRRFARFWLFASPHVLFVVDHVVSDEPLRVHWHWLLNNRDEQLQMKFVPPDRIVARRGQAGMKLFHVSSNLRPDCARLVRHAYVHDAYHPKPAQRGEGASGTGVLAHFIQQEAVTQSVTVHAIALDSYGRVAGWHLKQQGDEVCLESPGSTEIWALTASATSMDLREHVAGQHYRLSDAGDDAWSLTSVSTS